MTTSLSGKTVLVTGASRGIGAATARAFAKQGAHVLVHYGNSATEAEALVAELRQNGRADAVHADLEAADGAHLLAARVKELTGGKLDVLVANAGVAKMVPLEDTTVADFDWLYAVNVRAPFFLVQQLLPALGEGSNIIFTSSVVARAAVGNLAAYAGTKGAIDTLVKQFAALLGPKSIRVNAVAPGVIETDMSSFARSEDGKAFTLSMQALQRIGQPADIADVITFVASDEARWITGVTLEASGGSKL